MTFFTSADWLQAKFSSPRLVSLESGKVVKTPALADAYYTVVTSSPYLPSLDTIVLVIALVTVTKLTIATRPSNCCCDVALGYHLDMFLLSAT